MDHDATRELLETAAVEPGGLDRLMAGDTATAQAVAGHLAGCPACTDELARLERSSRLIRETVREMPSPELRARTMAAIRAEGVPRGVASAGVFASAGVGSAGVAPAAVAVAPLSNAAPAPAHRERSRQAFGWIATIAAAVVLSVVTTTLVVGARVDERLAAQAETISALQEVTTATLQITGQPDAEHVALAGVSDPSLDGSLVYSPSTAELVVVATGLTPPPSGQEYRCWVEVDGQRRRVGKMFFSDGLAYWVGPAPAVSGVSPGATFGVSLVGASGGTIDAAPVLVGEL
jgi:anti-sigma factor RsiW